MSVTKKPPYKVPSMRSIARTRKNGYKVVSTFCPAPAGLFFGPGKC